MRLTQISAKNLGVLAMPDYCPRCFWLKLNCKLPYQIFPGIFSSIDSFSKKITWGYYEKYSTLPNWFKPFGDFARPVKAPGRSVFFVNDERTNVKLTGIVDDIPYLGIVPVFVFCLSSGSKEPAEKR